MDKYIGELYIVMLHMMATSYCMFMMFLFGEVKQVAYKVRVYVVLYVMVEDWVDAYYLCTSMEPSTNLTRCFHSGSH